MFVRVRLLCAPQYNSTQLRTLLLSLVPAKEVVPDDEAATLALGGSLLLEACRCDLVAALA